MTTEMVTKMETFHILHLAACWAIEARAGSAEAPPLQHAPTEPSIPPAVHSPSTQTRIPDVATSSGSEPLRPPPRIRAAAAQMVFASRTSQDFITPQQVAAIEAWTGRAVLEALSGIEIEPVVSDKHLQLHSIAHLRGVRIQRLHEEIGSVWEIKERSEAIPR